MYAASGAFDPNVTIAADDMDRRVEAHQQELPVLSLAEVYEQFERPVARGTGSA